MPLGGGWAGVVISPVFNEPLPPSLAASWSRRDVALAAGFGLVGAVLTSILYARLTFTVAHLDVWFNSDSQLVYEQMTSRWSLYNDTNNRHPLFALLTFPLVYLLTRIGLEEMQAAFILLLGTSTAFIISIYVALRLFERPRGVAAFFTAIFLVSTPSFLFLGVHERLILGGFSTVLCLIVFQLVRQRHLPGWTLVAAAALTLGITITNFVIGASALLVAFGLRRGSQAIVNAFAVVALLTAPTVVLFPSSSVFMDVRSLPVVSSALLDDKLRASRYTPAVVRAAAFSLYAVVLPEPYVRVANDGKRYLSASRGISAYQPSGWVAWPLWATMLALGFVCSYAHGFRRPEDAVLLVGVVSQFLLFQVFASETILFSTYYVPLLIFVASRGAADLWAWPGVKILTAVLLVALTWNNAQVFGSSLRVALSLVNATEPP
jgi:hypothetical protein